MADKDFIDFLSSSLPENIQLKDVIPNYSSALPKNEIIEAITTSLIIDWNKYLKHNPDVKKNGMDPCSHFLRFGIFEGRKLYINNYNNYPETLNNPKVSVLIANFNNSVFLERCIGSVVNQTLKELEIIIVDDASTDESQNIIEEFAKVDGRIKVIIHENNQGTFMTRKHAVLNASGDYLIFLDSDDFLSEKACELAWNDIHDSYDIVTFNFNMLHTENSDIADISGMETYFNQIRKPIYNDDEILDSFFGEKSSPWNLIGKIFSSSLCKKAYNELQDGYYIFSEDLYALLAIARNANIMHKLNTKLYNYNTGIGITNDSSSGKKLRNWFYLGCTYKSFRNYCLKYELYPYYKKIYDGFLDRAMDKLLHNSSRDNIISLIEILIEQYGHYLVWNKLYSNISDNMEAWISKLPDQASDFTDNSSNQICICYNDTENALTIQTIKYFCSILNPLLDNITFILASDKADEIENSITNKINFIFPHIDSTAEGAQLFMNIMFILKDKKFDLINVINLPTTMVLAIAFLCRVYKATIIAYESSKNILKEELPTIIVS